MPELTASEAIEHALDEEYLKLYGVTCVGVLFGLFGAIGSAQDGGNALAVLFFVLSLPVVLVGVVATLRKLLEESA